MTSGEFKSFPLASITVDRESRQRRELKNIDELADSIERSGLINPLVITREGVLVAGERRYTACKQLGWTSVSIQFVDELDPKELHIIELEENTRRSDLTWQEECKAILEYDRLRREEEPSWSNEDTAKALGITRESVRQKKEVGEAFEQGNEKVKAAPKYSTAVNIVVRKKEREKASAIASIAEEPKGEVKTAPLLHANFTDWADKYKGPKFNFIHCDFPYGVNADKHAQGAAKEYGGYEDSSEIYWNLVNILAGAMDNVVDDSAHLMFWFSMDYYDATKTKLEEMGWRVNPFPLIWFKSDNTGILPDPARGPRRVYETAFMAARGDRKVVQAVGNAVAHPGREKELHMSEKPQPMLRHFFRMIVDEYTTMLDPTCGSANAVRVAEDLGASRVLGIEKDEEFFNLAKDAYYEI